VIKGEMLSKMISLATERHAGQYDKGGRPYILHPLTVMHRLRTDDDVMGFSPRVVLGIYDLTKYDGDSEFEYRKRVKANPDAIRVKIEDLRHNSDIRRLKGVRPKDIGRMVRYHEFYLELKAALASYSLSSNLPPHQRE
jgi:hypothetical protein